jgi:hypothetical protein
MVDEAFRTLQVSVPSLQMAEVHAARAQEVSAPRWLCSAHCAARYADECVKWLICLCTTALPRGGGETGDRAAPDAKAEAMVTDL